MKHFRSISYLADTKSRGQDGVHALALLPASLQDALDHIKDCTRLINSSISNHHLAKSVRNSPPALLLAEETGRRPRRTPFLYHNGVPKQDTERRNTTKCSGLLQSPMQSSKLELLTRKVTSQRRNSNRITEVESSGWTSDRMRLGPQPPNLGSPYSPYYPC